jgi:hypothetical protein
MTRLWPDGQMIEVEADASGIPQQFIWWGSSHRVETVAGRWRVDEDWWRVRIWREYFKVATTSGLLVVLFHDLEAGGWCLQRLYD